MLDCSAHTYKNTRYQPHRSWQHCKYMNISSYQMSNTNKWFLCLSAEQPVWRETDWVCCCLEKRMKSRADGGLSHQLSPFFKHAGRWPFFHCRLSLGPHCTFNLSHSAITLFYKLVLTDDLGSPVNFGKVWCLLLSAGFLFTPFCPNSLLTLQFTLRGKQVRTVCWLSFQQNADRGPNLTTTTTQTTKRKYRFAIISGPTRSGSIFVNTKQAKTYSSALARY